MDVKGMDEGRGGGKEQDDAEEVAVGTAIGLIGIDGGDMSGKAAGRIKCDDWGYPDGVFPVALSSLSRVSCMRLRPDASVLTLRFCIGGIE